MTLLQLGRFVSKAQKTTLTLSQLQQLARTTSRTSDKNIFR